MATEPNLVGRAIKEGAQGVSTLIDSVGSLVDKVEVPKAVAGDRKSKLFHILVLLLAAKGTKDLVMGEPGAMMKYFLKWVEVQALRTGVIGKKIYLEAKSLIKQGLAAQLEYFNYAYGLEGDDRLTSQAQLAAFLSKKVSGVCKALKEWEIPDNDKVIDSFKKKNEEYKRGCNTWSNVAFGSIGLALAVFLGIGLGSQHDSLVGILVFLLTLACFSWALYFRIRKQRAANSKNGAGNPGQPATEPGSPVPVADNPDTDCPMNMTIAPEGGDSNVS